MIICVILTTFYVVHACQRLPETPGLDFYHYWIVGQAISQSWTDDIYSAKGREAIAREARRTSAAAAPGSLEREAARANFELAEQSTVPAFHTINTPFFYGVFRLCQSGKYDADYRAYSRLNFLCFILAVIVLARLQRYSAVGVCLVVLVFGACFLPFQTEMLVASVNGLQLAVVALFFWLQGRPFTNVRAFLGGAVLGVAVLFKPNLLLAPGFVAAVWLINRRWREVLAMVVGFGAAMAAAVATASWAFGSARCWLQWWSIVPELVRSPRQIREGNCSLSNLILERHQVDMSLLLLAACVLVFGILGWRARAPQSATQLERDSTTNHAFQQTYLAMSLGLAITLLSARHVWAHYYVLLVPLALAALHGQDSSWFPRNRAAAAWSALAVASVAAFSSCLHLLHLPNARSFAIAFNLGLVGLLVGGLHQVHWLRCEEQRDKP
jgi:hypothetical protein